MDTDLELNFGIKLVPEEKLSKTKRKEHMQDLQKLGGLLVTLSKTQLANFNLSSELLDAIHAAQTIVSNGAIRRQHQYIGKLMRNADCNYIRKKLAEINNQSLKKARLLNTSKRWCELLLNDENHVQEFVKQYPKCNIAKLRDSVRVVHCGPQDKVSDNYRKLNKLICYFTEG